MLILKWKNGQALKLVGSYSAFGRYMNTNMRLEWVLNSTLPNLGAIAAQWFRLTPKMDATFRFTKVFRIYSIVLTWNKTKIGPVCLRSVRKIEPRTSYIANCRSKEWHSASLKKSFILKWTPSGPREFSSLPAATTKRSTAWPNCSQVSKNSVNICAKQIINGFSTSTQMTTWNYACPNLKSTPCHRSWRTAEICFISFM